MQLELWPEKVTQQNLHAWEAAPELRQKVLPPESMGVSEAVLKRRLKWVKWANKNREYLRKRSKTWYRENKHHARNLNRDWRKRNREKVRAIRLRYSSKHLDRIKQSNLKQYYKNYEKRLEDGKTYHWRNKDARNAKSRLYHATHYHLKREKLIAQTKAYAKSHPEVRRKAALNWKRNHPEKYQANLKANHCKRKARERGADVNDPKINALIRSWRMDEEFECSYCKVTFPIKMLHVDHIIPISKGGKHSCDNVCRSCSPCNIRKRDKILK